MKNRVPIIVAAGLVVMGAALVFMSRRSKDEPAHGPAPIAAPKPARTPDTVAPASSPAAGSTVPKPAQPSPLVAPEAPTTTGTLIIESDVPDTSVFIDRVYLGTAPVTARDVAPGPHRINLSPTGYDGYVETIDVVPGTRTIAVRFKEVRLDATLAVVHRHAIGSCTGTLHATPQGLAYDTANKNDAFTAPLTGLETFTMDYLAKILRVKIKGGKGYNFTDPEDNVNRLYLFHQEVEKARQRLIAGR